MTIPPNERGYNWLWVFHRDDTKDTQVRWIRDPSEVCAPSRSWLWLEQLKIYDWHGDTRYVIHRDLLEVP